MDASASVYELSACRRNSSRQVEISWVQIFNLCDGCISLSNAEGFVRCFLHLPQLGFLFSFWAYPPSFSARIRAYFFTNNKPTITLPVCFIPVSLPVHTPDLRNEIPYQSISLMIISHISCYNCCNLIFLLSFDYSPFIYRSCKDALNQGSLLKISLLRQPTPDYTLPAFSLFAIYRCVPRSCY